MATEVKKDQPRINDLYQMHWQIMSRENDNINQKVVWNVITQSFFFTGYAAVLNAPEKAKSPFFAHAQDQLLWILPIAALLALLLMLPSIVSSLAYMRKVNRQFETNLGDQVDYLPPLQKDKGLLFMAALSPLALPICFMGAWIIILWNLVRSGPSFTMVI
jgi:hypothetical protein